MQYPIIKTDNYLLVVSDELLEIGDWCYGENINTKGYKIDVHEAGSHDLHNKHPKIKAHLPLNNAPYLDGVDVLPQVEDVVEKLAEYEIPYSSSSTLSVQRMRFIHGYNKAKETYKYTEEDLRKAADLYVKFKGKKSIEELIKELQQPKYPIAFECEMVHETWGIEGIFSKPKTITNSERSTEWVGKYIY